uniref:Uncharacterized protein n=1 Tax=Romanomermis culicivorax TaxID=13658 RepID=A0A915ISJ4_ROMCU
MKFNRTEGRIPQKSCLKEAFLHVLGVSIICFDHKTTWNLGRRLKGSVCFSGTPISSAANDSWTPLAQKILLHCRANARLQQVDQAKTGILIDVDRSWHKFKRIFKHNLICLVEGTILKRSKIKDRLEDESRR